MQTPLAKTDAPLIPAYLKEHYDWAYVTPGAVRLFERQWLVNLILWGNYRRLRDAALAAFGDKLGGRSLQIACVYGDLSCRWSDRHGPDGRLDVVDVLPGQLANLAEKLAGRQNTGLFLANSAHLGCEPGSYDRALLFFLLHEQPESVRRATLAEALKALRPGGKLVIVDYHRPSRLHPLHWPMKGVLTALEPFALDLWRTDLATWLPASLPPGALSRRTYFGGLYQLVEISVPTAT